MAEPSQHHDTQKDNNSNTNTNNTTPTNRERNKQRVLLQHVIEVGGGQLQHLSSAVALPSHHQHHCHQRQMRQVVPGH